jgi:hypothetical protein
MTTRQKSRIAQSVLCVALSTLAQGCCNPCCYQQAPGCPLGVVQSQPAAIRYGSVCETPGEGSTVVASAPRPKVVVSQPNGGGGLFGGRNGWRRSDPESFATTRIEGAIDDDTTLR